MIKIDNEKLAKIYMNMINRLIKNYTRGFFIYTAIFQKNLDMDINKADDEVNGIWQECVAGKKTMMQFIAATNEYERLILRGLALYKGRKKYLP